MELGMPFFAERGLYLSNKEFPKFDMHYRVLQRLQQTGMRLA